MSNKIAIVTGGTKGIGKAISLELVKNNYHVYICARDNKGLENTEIEISKYGKVTIFELDISSRNSINYFVSKIKNKINVLINNAGISGIEKLGDDYGIWEKIINTNLNGIYYLTKALLDRIQKGGSIINISSQLGVEGRPGFGAYCASKHAVLGLTKCWAKELGSKNIRVNAISPGWVKTEMAMNDVKKLATKKGISTKEMYKEITKDLDLKRFIEPNEIANLASFLVSSEAEGITGQNYLIR